MCLRTSVRQGKSPAAAHGRGMFVSSPKNLHKVYTLSKFTDCEKMGVPSKCVASFYVNQEMNIHSPGHLWKTPVDKVVDNVENCELSTGIPFL